VAVSDAMNEAFGELRSLLQQSGKWGGWLKKMLGMLERARDMDPERYAAQWLPYLEEFEGFWLRHKWWTSDFDDGEAARVMEAAPFLYFASEIHTFADLERLGSFSRVDRVASLTFGDFRDDGDHIDMGGVATFGLTGLRRLNLINLGVGPRAAAAIAQSADFQLLEDLCLSGNPIGDYGVASLASSAHMGSLRILHLDTCAITDDGVEALSSSEHLAGLTHLKLGSNKITDAGAALLAGAHFAGALAELDIGWNHVTAEGHALLADSPDLSDALRARFAAKT